MMEFEYSPHHSPSTNALLLSPRHMHGSPLDGFPSIKQLRRSLSRSPSKPQKYTLFTPRLTAMGASTHGSVPVFLRTHSAYSSADSAPRQKYPIRRSQQARTATRRSSPVSPLRRALSDNYNSANVNQNMIHLTTDVSEPLEQENCDQTSESQDCQELIYDDPIKIDFLKPDKFLQPVIKEHTTPMKSSPLKRSDGVMNLEAAPSGSPRTKRRSLHGVSLGNEFNVFDPVFDVSSTDTSVLQDHKEKERRSLNSSTWPNNAANSPQRRPFSLRRSTLQQRQCPGRAKYIHELPKEPATPALTRARSRVSLDSALPLRGIDAQSFFRHSDVVNPPMLMQPPAQKLHQSAPKPHPLSHALTPSSSNSSMTEDQHPSMILGTRPERAAALLPPNNLSKSLPIGALRQSSKFDDKDGHASEDTFATPEGYQMARPLPQAFLSTGLISKRNRNIDVGPSSLFSSTNMPDTPSKKASHIHITSPAPPCSILGKVTRPVHEFGSPSTPFNARISKVSKETFGNGASIFGTRVGAAQVTRRGSFLSIDGEDLSTSPTHRLESQTSCEELPPTPTKSMTTATRPQSKGKNNSLRSSLFGRRTSLGLDIFALPIEGESTPLSEGKETTPSASLMESNECQPSPHTPQDVQEAITPPDPSSLCISAEHRPSTALKNSRFSFPPATPTGPKESHSRISLGQGHTLSNYFSNDVDTSLTRRFPRVSTSGMGEFSQVYRVERPYSDESGSHHRSNPSNNVWAVKKSRRSYTGLRDRQRKMREVEILRALRGQEHIIELVDSWESKNHLYIQTEFCENGNLKDFLTSTGFKGRLDDFRIWKILSELSQGVKSIHDAGFIHLDLKPANIFIDWEGVLKIGDFGMASAWPAPVGLDGEGDREYIGPEVLSGRFDKPADIFALGMIMLEIAGNIVLPDNGTSWQRLRSGDMSDLPSLTWSSDNSLIRDDFGEPIDQQGPSAVDPLDMLPMDCEDIDFLKPREVAPSRRTQDLVHPPNFMIDSEDGEALDRVVQWMISPNPDQRPNVSQLLRTWGVQWIEKRRRAGATIYEGNWGPADDVLQQPQDDIEMADI